MGSRGHRRCRYRGVCNSSQYVAGGKDNVFTCIEGSCGVGGCFAINGVAYRCCRNIAAGEIYGIVAVYSDSGCVGYGDGKGLRCHAGQGYAVSHHYGFDRTVGGKENGVGVYLCGIVAAIVGYVRVVAVGAIKYGVSRRKSVGFRDSEAVGEGIHIADAGR